MLAMGIACVFVVSAGLAWGQPTHAGSLAPPRQPSPPMATRVVLTLSASQAPRSLGTASQSALE